MDANATSIKELANLQKEYLMENSKNVADLIIKSEDKFDNINKSLDDKVDANAASIKELANLQKEYLVENSANVELNSKNCGELWKIVNSLMSDIQKIKFPPTNAGVSEEDNIQSNNDNIVNLPPTSELVDTQINNEENFTSIHNSMSKVVQPSRETQFNSNSPADDISILTDPSIIILGTKMEDQKEEIEDQKEEIEDQKEDIEEPVEEKWFDALDSHPAKVTTKKFSPSQRELK